LNIDDIAKEIIPETLNQSAFFKGNEGVTVQPNTKPNEQPNGIVKEQVLPQTIKDLEDAKEERTTKRFSFEIYLDQEEVLDEIQHQLKKKYKGKTSISKIIRDALDDYLPKLIKQTEK
jgi:hypothetical protein